MVRAAVTVVAVVAALATGCSTGADEPSVGLPAFSAPPSAPAPSAPAASSAASSEPTTPAQVALAAYRAYLDARVDALAAGDADVPALKDVAAGQALKHTRRSVTANADDGVVVTGTLAPSATVADVEIGSGQTTATVTDCVLNDLVQVSADDPETLVTEATGWRQPVTATVELTDDAWTVTNIEVPLEDGSGAVPPPPDDPPYLRGPAQGPAPPSCVPDELAKEAVAGYLAFQQAYDEALGFDGGPANPDLPALEETAVEPQLSGIRDFAQSLADDGQAFRGKADSHDAWAISANESDDRVVVYDCVTVGTYGAANTNATEPEAINADAGTVRLAAAGVVRDGEMWKVAGVSTIGEGLDECTSPTEFP